jgi:predicted small secreted protein
MKKSIGFLFTAMLAAGLLAGCNSNNSTTPPGVGTNCGNPPAGFQVLYPRPNAGAIGPNVGGVYVAANPALPVGNSYDFFVVQTNGFTQHTSPFATYNGPIPTPHKSPPPGSTVYVTQFLYPIGPLQGVNLYWNDGGTACTPNVIVSSFSTTQ